MNVPAVLAALTLELPKENRRFGRTSSLLVSDMLIIAGVGAGLLLLLVLGAYIWFKARKRRKHISGGEKVYRGGSHSDEQTDDPVGDDQHEHQDEDEEDDDSSSHHGGKRRYKYRVRRRTHRTRNPTLSEVGGLPPVKTPQSGKPC